MKIIYFPEQKIYQDKFIYEAKSAYGLKEGKERFATRWLFRQCREITEVEAKEMGLEIKSDPRFGKTEKNPEVKKPETVIETEVETETKTEVETETKTEVETEVASLIETKEEKKARLKAEKAEIKAKAKNSGE